MIVNKYNENYAFSDGETTSSGQYIWVKCEPVVWNITNWNALPSNLNPSSTLSVGDVGVATTISCLSKYALVSIGHYYPNITDSNRTAWQNSAIRAYLNGYDIAEELASGNGSTTYEATIKPTFKNLGFVDTIWHAYITN